MTAELFSPLGTPYQRLINEELLNPFSNWQNGPGFGPEFTVLRTDSSFNAPYEFRFHGPGLGFNGSEFAGTVNRFEIFEVIFEPGKPLEKNRLVEVDGFAEFDMAKFVELVADVAAGEPDFSANKTARLWDMITPDKSVGTGKKDFFDAFGDQFEIVTGKGNDVVLYGGGSGTISFGPGKKDAFDARNATESIDLDIGKGEAKSGSDIIIISGGKFFFGTELDDRLTGGGDTDQIFGRGGNDVIDGLASRDVLFGDSGDDVLRGGSGGDELFGEAGNDALLGQADDDFLFGGIGNDRLIGGSGTDTLNGGDGNDTLNGGRGFDILEGGKGADVLKGGSNFDSLRGGGGNDTLKGGRGDDNLQGESGNDKMTGNGGSDSFMVLNDEKKSGSDTITDFEKDIDRLVLQDQSAENVTVTSTGSSGNSYRVTHEKGDILVKMTDLGATLTIDDITF